jgi:hypothetical protein
LAKFTPICSASETTSAASARHQRNGPSAVAAAVPTSTGEIAAPNVFGRAPATHFPTGVNTGPVAPELDAGWFIYGRLGNWSKSGARFSRYAFLPSCASSVM